MNKNKRIYPGIVLIVSITLIVILGGFGSFYTYWNTASPDKTCASCHEIGGAVHSLTQSSHRKLHCKECHGTALSNGIHSLKEKSMMVINHVKESRVEDIRMNEDQMLSVMDNCIRCHASEYAGWQSGGHSATYGHIFLDSIHNKTEQLNFDCLRCHGMFYAGTTYDLVGPINLKGPWKMKDPSKKGQPSIPCMACHQMHSNGHIAKKPNYSMPASMFYLRDNTKPNLSFYDRHEKVNVSSDLLPKLKLYEGERVVSVSDDHLMRNCVQCHAADSWHEAGTSDDRTPRGVHEGLSCLSCHEPHSNDAKKSCIKCHPAISNCKLDVTAMNTTFADPESPNNVHFVACTDCHQNDARIKSSFKESDINTFQ